MADEVLVHIDGAVGVLELNRPEKFNCISKALVAGLNEGLDQLEGNADIRAVVLKGAGKVFCTGADLEEILETRQSAAGLHALLRDLLHVLRRLETSPLPIIGAVHGLVLAGGLEITMVCDVVFAARSAKLGDQHAQYGLVPGGGNSQRLTRVLGRRRALDLMFSARWLEAQEAHAWGLVNYVVDDDQLINAAMAYARKLAAHSAPGLAMMKRMSDAGSDLTLEQGLELEIKMAVEGLRGSDADEGLKAFQERRVPQFGQRQVG
ncbi:MAG: enoyl-CoA hydratase/isomerase family protein [Gammaproteobacteria bacterium]|nr:enoyl-CoA hydratase/isomerase family protein [Gammaproteobacteria bacterium]